jgi:hypothetical protein
MRITLLVIVFVFEAAGAAQDASLLAPPEIVNVARNNWRSQLATIFPTPEKGRLTTESPVRDLAPGVTIPDFGGALQDYVNRLGPGASLDSRAPFGGSLLFTFAGGRLEVFGGLGGIFVPWASSYTRPNSWLTQTSAGARVALDPNRRVWLGVSTYLLTNSADKTRSRAYPSADLTFRFGK